MKYGYNIKQPTERQMYIEKHKRDLQRSFSNKTPQENYNDIMAEKKKEFDYFYNREKIEVELENELKKQASEKLPEILEKQLEELLNGFELFK